MKRYYDILGLPENATKDQVKRAYRKLVMRYHPDRNPTPQGQVRFLLIQEAYDAISSGKLPTHINKETPFEKRKREEEQRIKKAKARYQQQRAQEQFQEHKYFKQLTTGKQWLIFKTLSYACAAVSFLLLLEYFLPHHFAKDTIRGYSMDAYGGLKNTSVILIELMDQGKFWIENTGLKSPFDYHTCYVEQTWIFHQPINLHHPQNGINYFIYPIDFTVYAIFPLSAIAFLIPIFTVYYKRKNANFSILYHTSYYVIFVLLVLFLATHDRWLHLITAGTV